MGAPTSKQHAIDINNTPKSRFFCPLVFFSNCQTKLYVCKNRSLQNNSIPNMQTISDICDSLQSLKKPTLNPPLPLYLFPSLPNSTIISVLSAHGKIHKSQHILRVVFVSFSSLLVGDYYQTLPFSILDGSIFFFPNIRREWSVFVCFFFFLETRCPVLLCRLLHCYVQGTL